MNSPPDEDGWIVYSGPENHCFGCSPHNPRGLRMRFRAVGEHTIEAPYRAEKHLCGAPNVVHGGIQAVLLDEAMGIAAQTAYPDETAHLVTAQFRLEYKRPVATDVALIVRARWLRQEGRSDFITGEIEDEVGNVLTRADARWVRIDR